MSVNRRQWMIGAAALLGECSSGFSQSAFLRSAAAAKPEDQQLPPQNLLSQTYTHEFLSRNLLSPSAWHPYPTIEDRTAWNNIPQDVQADTLERANAVLGKEWPQLLATEALEFKRNGNRSRFEALTFGRRRRLTDLTLAECIEGKGRFLDEIANGIWLICEETFWGVPAHLGSQKRGVGLPDVTEPIVELFSAETAGTLSWVDYFLGARLDSVSPLIRERIRIEAKRRVLDPCLNRDDFWWMGLGGKPHALNNWNPWINSNWMLTNLRLEEDSSRRIRAMVKICSSLDQFLDQYSPDGGCIEGPGYWRVSAVAYFTSCARLASATGGKQSVVSNPFIAKMGHYIVDAHIAGPYFTNYGDAHAEAGPSAETLYRFGAATGDQALQEFGSFIATRDKEIPKTFEDVLTVASARNGRAKDALERDSWYPALRLMTAREKADSTDGFYLAVQAAPNQRSHGHNDSGSFIVFHDGSPVFIDAGVEAYTAKTFGPQRYSIWTMQSAYHNLPTINGVMQTDHDATNRASLLGHTADDNHAELALNLAPAYPRTAGIDHWNRKLTLDRRSKTIQITEDFQLNNSVPVALSFMSARVPSQASSGKLTFPAQGHSGRDVSLQFDPDQLEAKIEPVPLTDEGMRKTWGNTIYRVLLNSKTPVKSGNWVIHITA